MLYIFDNQCPPGLAQGLALLENGNRNSDIKVKVKHISELISSNSTDEKIIECAGSSKGIIITLDKDFKYHSTITLYIKNTK